MTNKTYETLLNELDGILDEVEEYKKTFSSNKIGLWKNSTYIDELLYIYQCIQKEMMVYNPNIKIIKTFKSL